MKVPGRIRDASTVDISDESIAEIGVVVGDPVAVETPDGDVFVGVIAFKAGRHFVQTESAMSTAFGRHVRVRRRIRDPRE